MKNEYEILGNKTRIFLPKGGYTDIDTEDFDRVSNVVPDNMFWYKNHGYVVGNRLLLHRFITSCPKDLVVDHLNHFRWDNRKINLRICTPSENRKNVIHYAAAYEENKRFDKKRGIVQVKEKEKIIPMLTNQEVMELLNVNERTLYEYREKQGLPYFKLNSRTFRYEKEMVMKWLSERLENKQK